MRHFLLESDLVLPKAITPLGYKQYDNGDLLEVEFWNDSERINLTNEKVLAFFELIDGVIVQKTCEIKNGNAIATLDNNILSKPGQIKCEFTIYKGTTLGAEETTTKTIIIEVSKSIDRINSITSAPHWDIVQEMLNKNDIIDDKIKELEAKKNEAIATVTKIKDETIVQLNTTTEEVKTLKKETIEESIKIKGSAITALEQIKADSIKELNNIKDIANADLESIKKSTIEAVTKVAQEAINSINKYNIQDVSKKLDEHIADNNLHVTKELKDSIAATAKDIDNLKQDFKYSTLTSFKTDVLSTKLEGCAGGFVNIESVKGKTELINEKLFSVGDPVGIGNNLYTDATRTFTTIGNTASAFYFYIRKANAGDTFLSKNYYPSSINRIRYIFNSMDNSKLEVISGINGNIKDDKKLFFIDVKPYTDYIAEYTAQKNDDNSYTLINPIIKECAYKLEILSDRTGNLYDEMKSNIDIGFNNSNTSITTTNELTQVAGVVGAWSYAVSKQKIILEPNTVYTLSAKGYKNANSSGSIRIIPQNNSDKNTMTAIYLNTTNDIIKASFDSGNIKECYMLYYPNVAGDTSTGMYLEYVQLEKGTVATEYKKYKGDTTEILMQQPLTQYDYIDENGKLNLSSYVEVFNGSESTWSIYSTSTRHTFISAFKNSSYSKTAICDKYTPITDPSNFDKVNGFYAFALGGFIISDTSCSTIDELKNKLKLNPITVVYQQCDDKYNPIYRSINLNKTLVLRGHDNLIVNSGAIQPQVNYSYAKNVGERIVTIEDTLDSVKDKVSNLNEYNEIKLTPLNGYLEWGISGNSIKRSGNTCTINIVIDTRNVTFPLPITNTPIFKLPNEFRPKKWIFNAVVPTDKGFMALTVDVNGDVLVGDYSPPSKPTWIIGTITYVI